MRYPRMRVFHLKGPGRPAPTQSRPFQHHSPARVLAATIGTFPAVTFQRAVQLSGAQPVTSASRCEAATYNTTHIRPGKTKQQWPAKVSLSSMRIRPKAAQRGAAEKLSKEQQHSNGRQRRHRQAYCDTAAMSPRAARLLRSSGANGSRGGGFVHEIKRHKQRARKTAGCGDRCPQRAARPGARKWRWRLPLIDPWRVIRHPQSFSSARRSCGHGGRRNEV